MEHRWGQRVPVGMRVRLSCLPYAIGSGWLRDVSVSGAFIETNLRLPLLASVHVEVELPGCGRATRHSVAGHVARQAEDGVGIEWPELAPAAVVELLAPAPTAAEHSGATEEAFGVVYRDRADFTL